MEATGLVYCAEGDTGNGFASYDTATDSWTPLAADPFVTDHYGSASGAFNGNPPNSNAGFEPASFAGPKARNVPVSNNVQRPTLNLKTAIEPQINDHGRR